MKIFMNMNLSKDHASAVQKLLNPEMDSTQVFLRLLEDRPKGHVLIPPKNSGDEVILRNFRFDYAQRKWADERGMPKSTNSEAIALAQIEESGAEIFYNHNWQLMSKDFVARLPGCVRYKVAWHGAPSPNLFCNQYDLVLSNWPSLNKIYIEQGARRVEYFTPSHDHEAEKFHTDNRDIDVLFVGSYSRSHNNRAKLLEQIAELDDELKLQIHLQNSKFTPLAETPLGLFGPLKQVRRGKKLRRIARDPVFGLDLYRLMGRSKIVVNMAINYGGSDRGNMRCFETLSCGAALVSDEGNYPSGFLESKNFISYKDNAEAIKSIRELVADEPRLQQLASEGLKMVNSTYSAVKQWNHFVSFL